MPKPNRESPPSTTELLSLAHQGITRTKQVLEDLHRMKKRMDDNYDKRMSKPHPIPLYDGKAKRR